MPTHRLLIVAGILTLLGLDLVYLQVQRVRLGYRVAQESERLQRLQEAVRLAEVQANRRRDPVAVRMRAQAWRVAPESAAAGRVLRFAPGTVRVVTSPAGRTAEVASRP